MTNDLTQLLGDGSQSASNTDGTNSLSSFLQEQIELAEGAFLGGKGWGKAQRYDEWSTRLVMARALLAVLELHKACDDRDPYLDGEPYCDTCGHEERMTVVGVPALMPARWPCKTHTIISNELKALSE